MISVLAFITTLPGRRDEVLNAYRANTVLVRSEYGCIEYVANVDPMRSEETPSALGQDSFVIVEKWENFACLQSHRTSPHMIAYAAKVKHLTATRVVHVLTSVDEEIALTQ
jgi:quinol monooxygenase YgiN